MTGVQATSYSLFRGPRLDVGPALLRSPGREVPVDLVDLQAPYAPARSARTHTASAGPGAIESRVPDARRKSPAARVPITLLAEEPSLLPVPDTRQSTDYSCGAAALQAVLMHWGVEYMESTLMERLHSDPQNGTNPRDIVRVAIEEGLEAELRESLSLDDLKKSLDAGCPVIVACQAWRDGDDLQKPWSEVWDSGHYMVVVGIDDENVYFEDPSLLGSRGFIARGEFEERWHDVDDKPYVRSGIFIRGEKPSPPPPLVHVD